LASVFDASLGLHTPTRFPGYRARNRTVGTIDSPSYADSHGSPFHPRAGSAVIPNRQVMPVRIPSGWWAVAENSLARAWENSLMGVGQFELVGVLRLRNRSAARSSCSAQDDKSSSFAVTLSPRLSLGEGCRLAPA